MKECESSVQVLRKLYDLKYAAFVFASVNASGISANGEKSNRIWLLNRSTHPCSAATATWYHVLSCGWIKKSVFYILPQSTGMSTFALDVRASGWASNAPHFRRVSRSKAFPKQGWIFLSRWWRGSFGEVTACVVLRWCVPSSEPPHSLTPPVLLQHSLSGHLDGVCELFESEACLCEHLLFQPKSLSLNSSAFFFF